MTHRDIIKLWPKTADFARDLGISPLVTAYAWKRRGRIPAEYWPAVIEAAKAREFEGVTLEALSEGATPRARKRAA